MYMKRFEMILPAFLFAATAMWAVPAQRTQRVVTLAGGTSITVTVCGDENGLRYVTSDGRFVMPQADGTFAYATPSETAALRRNLAPQRVGSRATAPLSSFGHVNVPVVLVQFSDRQFIQTDPELLKQEYDLFFNGENYTGHGSVSSVRDYFLHESDSLFLPRFEILGPVTLDKGYAYYGSNQGGMDANYPRFRTEALQKLLKANQGFDWAPFDNGGNGGVDMVFFIFAGTGENSTHVEDELWPKESTVSTTIDGTVFETSALCNEARAQKDGTLSLDGIGVILHELMHSLGMPDFYDTAGGSAPVYGMDLFSIMDYGEYNNNGYSPTGLTAYERDFLGWRQLEELTEEGTYTLLPVNGKGAKGYKITNDLNKNEYYVLEYRAGVGNDKGLAKYASGMTVTHVDYQSSAWNANRVNVDASHQRMTPLPAAGRGFGVDWVTGDMKEWLNDLGYVPFPGKGLVDSLTNESPLYPSVAYTGQYMSKPIYNIREDEERQTVTFSYLVRQEEGTAVQAAIASTADAGTWRTLDGRPLYAVPKRPGIYIRDGKKILMK